MSRFDLKTETIHHPEWDEGETVTIREMTYAESQRLAMAGMSQDMKIPTDKKQRDAIQARGFTVADMDLERMKITAMMAGIQSWTFCNGDGKPVPVTEENIRLLSVRDGDFIMEAIDALNPERDDDFPEGSD